MKTTQEKLDNQNKLLRIMQQLERILNGDSHNSPPSYLAQELRTIATELDLLEP